MADINIWGLNLKGVGDRECTNPFRFAMNRGFAGVGWAVGLVNVFSEEDPVKFIKNEVKREYDWNLDLCRAGLTAIDIVTRQMKVNDLCWTREPDCGPEAPYYLGRIVGEWFYRPVDPKEPGPSDITTIRATDWVKVGPKSGLPKAVRNCIPPQAIQKAFRKRENRPANLYSRYMYNILQGRRHYNLSKDVNTLESVHHYDLESDLRKQFDTEGE